MEKRDKLLSAADGKENPESSPVTSSDTLKKPKSTIAKDAADTTTAKKKAEKAPAKKNAPTKSSSAKKSSTKVVSNKKATDDKSADTTQARTEQLSVSSTEPAKATAEKKDAPAPKAQTAPPAQPKEQLPTSAPPQAPQLAPATPKAELPKRPQQPEAGRSESQPEQPRQYTPQPHYQNGGGKAYSNGSGPRRQYHDYRGQDGRPHDSRQRNVRHKNSYQQSNRDRYQKVSSDKSREKRTHEIYQFLKNPDRPPLEELTLTELNLYARMLGIVGAGLMRRDKLIERIRYIEANPDMEIEVEGVLEKLPDGFGFLRSAQYDYISGPDDIYVSPSQIRRFALRTGDTITGTIRKPKEGEKYFALLHVKNVNFEDTPGAADRYNFDALTPKHPDEKLNLEFDEKALSTRMMDIFTPVGKGQRGLIVAPPKVGKTLLLKEIAQSIIANHSDIYLIVLLVDERPEEVADMKKTVRGTSAEVVSSTFDESAERHIQVAEAILEKAKRLVESGKDVVILLDSITRLARAYNTNAPASGKVLTGGIDANALTPPKRFFGAARSTEEAGSLTIIATALVDTGSRMDEVIYEEFKGTGNLEMHMTRKLSNRRIYPAFDLLVSGTRREELLHTEEDLNRVWVLQKFLATMNTIEGMEFLIDKMKKAKNNRDFLNSINR